MNEEAIATAIQGHHVRNLRLKKDLKKRGATLDSPRPIDFHFLAWEQRDAAVLAKSLYEMGFLVMLLTPAPRDTESNRWAIEAGTKISIAQASGSELTERLVRLAAQADAVFDGWGTSL